MLSSLPDFLSCVARAPCFNFSPASPPSGQSPFLLGLWMMMRHSWPSGSAVAPSRPSYGICVCSGEFRPSPVLLLPLLCPLGSRVSPLLKCSRRLSRGRGTCMGNQEALTAGDDMEAPDPFIGGWGGTDSGDTDPAEDEHIILNREGVVTQGDPHHGHANIYTALVWPSWPSN